MRRIQSFKFLAIIFSVLLGIAGGACTTAEESTETPPVEAAPPAIEAAAPVEAAPPAVEAPPPAEAAASAIEETPLAESAETGAEETEEPDAEGGFEAQEE